MKNSESDYGFELPAGLIAQDPAVRRGDSRLLLVEPAVGVVAEKVFRVLPSLLQAGDLLVMNESRVLPARIMTNRVDTGGQVEILLVRPLDNEPLIWLALARPGKRLRQGIRLQVQGTTSADQGQALPQFEVVAKRDDGQILISCQEDPGQVAETWGEMPLPPYIQRQADSTDEEQRRRDRLRYQTVFCRADSAGAGSVAAPTAGLHFSAATLAGLAAAGIATAMVRLHVGPGTFRPPTAEQISLRRLHREYFHLPAATSAAIAKTRARGGRVIAVGTTSLRVLETVARLSLDESAADQVVFPGTDQQSDPVFTGEAHRQVGDWDVAGSTRLFIKPPDKVQAADGLLTNFHLPDSSLLMLVASLMGAETWRGVYRHAVQQQLRFYSYGDCMLILPGLGAGLGSAGGQVS